MKTAIYTTLSEIRKFAELFVVLSILPIAYLLYLAQIEKI